MILSTKERNKIAAKCKSRLDILKRQGTTVTSVPKPGEFDILKECYSEGSKPGILVELAKCKGLGKSKFAEIVKEMNKERKKFSKDYRDSYYSKVAEFVSSHASSDEIKEDIDKLNKLFKEIQDIQNEACEHACKQREAWHKLNDAGRYDKAEKCGRYIKTIREQFKRTNILWFQQGMTSKVLFLCMDDQSKPVIALEDGFGTWSNSFNEARRLGNKFIAVRNKILTIFKNNKKLEPYLLTASNSKEAGEEIQSILKRIANRKDFVKKQSHEWGHYVNKKGKNQPKEEWDKVKLEAAEYMSELEWQEGGTTELRLKEAFKNFRKKQNNYSGDDFTTLKKYLKEHKPVEVEEASSTPAQSN